MTLRRFNLDEVYDVSLIVCTRNRADQLQFCLEKISNIQTMLNWQVIVVDNNSTDKTSEVLNQFGKTCLFPFHPAFEKKTGLGAARNCGAAIAKSNILIYIDDDCYPEVDLVDEYYKAFLHNPHLGFISGRVELHDPLDLPITIQTRKQHYHFQPGEYIQTGFILGANIGINKKALIEVDGWDERFGAGTKFPCEDLDMAARILCTHWHGAYDPLPCVRHHHQRRLESDRVKLMILYDAGRGGFYGKCLTDKKLCSIYIWKWLKSFRYKPRQQILRELKFAVIYLWETFKQAS